MCDCFTFSRKCFYNFKKCLKDIVLFCNITVLWQQSGQLFRNFFSLLYLEDMINNKGVIYLFYFKQCVFYFLLKLMPDYIIHFMLRL